MKHSIITRNFFKVSSLALVMAVSLVACDDDEVVPVENKAQIGVLNLMSDGSTLDAHLGDAKINTAAITGSNFAYITADAGQNRLSLFESGQTDTLLSQSYDFKAGESFSVIALGTNDNATLVMASDDLRAPAGGKSKIRFANFIDGNNELELWVEDGEEALQEGTAYKGVRSFIEVEPSTSLSLQVKATGSDDVLAELADATVESGKIYTLYVTNQMVEGEQVPVLRIAQNK